MWIKNATENRAAIKRIAIHRFRSKSSNPKLSINLKRKKYMFFYAYLLKVADVT
jgi:hypothetical protein